MESDPQVPLTRVQYCAIYSVGFFCLSTVQMMAVLTPLYVAHLGYAPFLAGIIIGSRGVSSAMLAIHGGALMDRLGPRRVVLCVTFMGMITPPLFLVVTWAPAMILLQMASGLVTSFSWIGTFALMGQILNANTRHAGHLTFFSRIGTFAGPPLIGILYDQIGFVGGFWFMSGWCAVLFISALLMPSGTASVTGDGKLTVHDILPRWSDYALSFRLLATPAVALIGAVSALTIATGSIQSSFYLVHLQQGGFSGTLIGTLLATAAFCATVATLFTDRMTQHLNPTMILLGTAIAAIVSIAVAPFFGSVVAIFIVLSIRGIADGMNQPLLFTEMSKAVGGDSQGRAVGLRIALNRASTASTPMILGGLIQLTDFETAFLAAGSAMLLILWVVAVIAHKATKAAP